MGRLSKPVTFSEFFEIEESDIKKVGAFNPILNGDSLLFVDPLLLEHSSVEEMANKAVNLYSSFFGTIIDLLAVSEEIGDPAWLGADRKLDVHEPPEVCLGYSGGNVRGSALGPVLRTNILHTAKKVVNLGADNPHLFPCMAILEDKIGPDRIGDITTHIIFDALLDYNERILPILGVKTGEFVYGHRRVQLCTNPFEKRKLAVILVPRDVLRDLPTADDWRDVSKSAQQTKEIKNRVNEQIGEIWKARTHRQKAEIKARVLADKKAFDTLLELVTNSGRTPYDLDGDRLGLTLWQRARNVLPTTHPLVLDGNITCPEDLEKLILKIVDHFKYLVEFQGLWKLLWDGDVARYEMASQLLFRGIAEGYCQANDVDISPECDNGGGPVDFKFSKGMSLKYLIEVKLSSNTKLVHGYEKQLEVYRDAEQTEAALFLIIDVGKLGKKLEKLTAMRNAQLKSGKRASDFIVIDGNQRSSASKR